MFRAASEEGPSRPWRAGVTAPSHVCGAEFQLNPAGQFFRGQLVLKDVRHLLFLVRPGHACTLARYG